MSSDISPFRTLSPCCFPSRLVIIAHHKCCGAMFEGRYKANLLRKSNESREHLDLVTLVLFWRKSSCSGASIDELYAQLILLTEWLDIHRNSVILLNSLSISNYIHVDMMPTSKMWYALRKIFWTLYIRIYTCLPMNLPLSRRHSRRWYWHEDLFGGWLQQSVGMEMLVSHRMRWEPIRHLFNFLRSVFYLFDRIRDLL